MCFGVSSGVDEVSAERAERRELLLCVSDGLRHRHRGAGALLAAGVLSDGLGVSSVALDGAVSLVNASQQGSRVGVIEGEVRVLDGKVETKLRPGEQLTTSATIAQRPLAEDLTWSRNANAHLAVLDSFKKGMAEDDGSSGRATADEPRTAVGRPEICESAPAAR